MKMRKDIANVWLAGDPADSNWWSCVFCGRWGDVQIGMSDDNSEDHFFCDICQEAWTMIEGKVVRVGGRG